jgi:hypothetical protein
MTKKKSTNRAVNRAKSTDAVAELKALVTRLIAENKRLKARVERASTKATTAVAPRGLATLARKAERALASSRSVKTVRRKPSTLRRPVSPETAEKRRQALTKARQVRAEKRAEIAAAQGSRS